MALSVIFQAQQTKTEWTRVVLPPLNLRIYFRVVMHLHQLGYPSHWLSEILVTIIENKVVSSVRKFETCPLKPSELTKKHPLRKLSTTPYVPEMTTLTVLFQRILPFAVLTPLPLPKTIHCFSIKIPIDRNKEDTSSNHSNDAILVFYRSSLMKSIDQDREFDKLLDPLLNYGKASVRHSPNAVANLY